MILFTKVKVKEEHEEEKNIVKEILRIFKSLGNEKTKQKNRIRALKNHRIQP